MANMRLGLMLIGVGLGGWLDVIVFHELLQWHHLISGRVSANTLSGLQRNVRADGIFLAFAWVVTAAGAALLWRAARTHVGVPRAVASAGLVLLGWGLFNLLDEGLFHLAFGLHHIRQGHSHLGYDAPYGAVALIQVLTGASLARR
jgi:uncharacterized membrane protein